MSIQTACDDDVHAAGWPLAVEQIETVAFLRDPTSHGVDRTAYIETALSHMVFAGAALYILRRPLKTDDFDCLNLEQRWRWCEGQVDKKSSPQSSWTYRPLPIVKRAGMVSLGGPGIIEDWVLMRRKRAAEPRHQAQTIYRICA